MRSGGREFVMRIVGNSVLMMRVIAGGVGGLVNV